MLHQTLAPIKIQVVVLDQKACRVIALADSSIDQMGDVDVITDAEDANHMMQKKVTQT